MTESCPQCGEEGEPTDVDHAPIMCLTDMDECDVIDFEHGEVIARWGDVGSNAES